MGMYTSIVISARLKRSTPASVTDLLRAASDDSLSEEQIDTMIGLGKRVPIMGSSAYFPEPCVDVSASGFSFEGLSLTLVSNIKNYDNEIEGLIEYIKPWVESGHGVRDWWCIVTYEEDESPTIHYLRE